ncbi:MAG: PIG-L family deacetylase [Methanophagales archaeon]|nr:PIG-L family deacetylase [Methanophagales archaeon]MCW3137009.1 PIG-L family deacetylase [Methanophagales archaeon]
MFSKLLIIAPHTDDGELGCGGTIARFIEEGKEVYYAAFSVAEKSVPEGFPKNELEIEVKRAMKVLGVPENNLFIYRYEVRTFSYYRQDILEDLVKLKKELEPTLIFIPSLNDLHQDHKTIAEEGCRAFKTATLLGYEEPWNNISFKTSSFVPLEKRHIKKKIDALKEYKTQRYRSYLNEDFIRGLAKTRGTQINKDYAEAFEVIRWII